MELNNRDAFSRLNPLSFAVSVSDPWTIADVIDFEYLLTSEASSNAQGLSDHERALFQSHLPTKSGEEPSRQEIFKAWIETRREGEGSALPGEHFTAGWQSLITLSALAGLFLGGSLVAALLHYKGDEPVNVSWFLVCTIGVQLLILLAVALIWAIRRVTHLFENFGPLQWVLAGLVWAFSAGLQRLPGEKRERLRAALSVIRRKREIYGSLATWPLLVVTQIFAVSYNLGMILILLAHVSTTDLAFGWQSTLQTSPDEAFRIIRGIAAPWAWLFPNAHPSLAQVVASRFQYSAGLKPLSNAAMASWWPFLCYAIFFYGLLIRGAILVFASVKMRSDLKGLTLDHQGCNALYRKLTGPIIRAQSGTAILEIPETVEPVVAHPVRAGRCIALVAAELDLGREPLAEYLKESYRWELEAFFSAQIDHARGNVEALALVAEKGADLAAVVIVVQSKRSPIMAIALFLQKVIAAAGTKPELLLLLVGRKDGATFLPVGDDEFTHWRNFNEIRGLHLELEKWNRL
ncbi:MAG: hypothetical protein JWL59_3929 [Chthoniobacteraceae bacterium]|nr:hypothetical protein [Chthoniobacteraceae bacterium]